MSDDSEMPGLSKMFEEWKAVAERGFQKSTAYTDNSSAAIREDIASVRGEIAQHRAWVEKAFSEMRTDTKSLFDQMRALIAKMPSSIQSNPSIVVPQPLVHQVEAPVVVNNVPVPKVEVKNEIKWPERKPELIRVVDRDKQGRIELLRIE